MKIRQKRTTPKTYVIECSPAELRELRDAIADHCNPVEDASRKQKHLLATLRKIEPFK